MSFHDCSKARIHFPGAMPLALRRFAVDEHTIEGLVLGVREDFTEPHSGQKVTVVGRALYDETLLLPPPYQRASNAAGPSYPFEGPELSDEDLDVALDLARATAIVFAPVALAALVVDWLALSLRAEYRLPIAAAVKIAASKVSSNTDSTADILARVQSATSFPCPAGGKIDPALAERKEAARRRHEEAVRVKAAEVKDRAPNTKSFAERRLHVFSHPSGPNHSQAVADLAWSQVALGSAFKFEGRDYYAVPYAFYPLAVPPQDFGLIRFHDPNEVLACPEGLIRAAERPKDVRPYRVIFRRMREGRIDTSPAPAFHADTTLEGARRADIFRKFVGSTLVELHANRDVARRGPYGGQRASAFDFLVANNESLAYGIRGLSLDVITACEVVLEVGRAEAESKGIEWVDLPYDANKAIERFTKLATCEDTIVATDELLRDTNDNETSALLLERPDLDPWRPTIAKLASERDLFTTADVEAALRADGFEPKPVPSHWRRVAGFLKSLGFKKRDKAGADKTRAFVRVDGAS